MYIDEVQHNFFLVASLANRGYTLFLFFHNRENRVYVIYTRIIFSSLNICTSVSSVALDEHQRKIYS